MLLPRTAVTTPRATPDKFLELAFTADRDQLYAACSAIAKLADCADNVSLVIRAENPEGFDQTKLQNGVIDPLREADLID